VSSPGWYPDPAGDPALERYWDGHDWTPATRGAAPPPDRTVLRGEPAWAPSERPRRRRAPLVLAAVLAALLVAGAVAAVVRVTRDGDGPEPIASRSATGSPSGSTSPSARSALLAACPEYDGELNHRPVQDGRLVGGGLSVPEQAGWEHQDDFFPFYWFDDLQGQLKQVRERGDGGWWETLAVGRLPLEGGYTGLRQAAESLIGCIGRKTSFYPRGSTLEPISSTAVTVDGHDAWQVRADILAPAGEPARGDLTTLVLVDLGDDEAYAGFFMGVVLDDPQEKALLGRTVRQLRVVRD